ncbi:hypothetical protein PFLUV_G00045500 [Perca fluviatilis]|uniref:FCH domain-containing protein n=1 Tax=Perca fluviatilis TaxID=8168 RepID=A0A6A5EQQ0_PERFL|nr:hypothetical protein PFLUV_G00045500 [Perca fluviatilis]
MSSHAKVKKDKEIIAEYETQVKEIRNQLVEQFRCLEQQSESRLQLLQDLQEFFRRKAELQLEYSRGLDKLAERYSAKIRTSRAPLLQVSLTTVCLLSTGTSVSSVFD